MDNQQEKGEESRRRGRSLAEGGRPCLVAAAAEQDSLCCRAGLLLAGTLFFPTVLSGVETRQARSGPPGYPRTEPRRGGLGGVVERRGLDLSGEEP